MEREVLQEARERRELEDGLGCTLRERFFRFRLPLPLVVVEVDWEAAGAVARAVAVAVAVSNAAFAAAAAMEDNGGGLYRELS